MRRSGEMRYTGPVGTAAVVDDNKRNFDLYLEERSSDIAQVIHKLWSTKDQTLWGSEPYFYITLGEKADEIGQVMFAHDVLREGLEYFPGHLRLTQLYCLSAVKCGYITEARELLSALVKAGHQDEETLAILGRVHKESWVISGEDKPDHPSLRTARSLYLQAFLRHGGYYSGINAATLSALAGEWKTAEKIAKRVLAICREQSERGNADQWLLATIGEAFALVGNREESLRSYAAARARSGSNFSELASMRRQLKLLRRVTPIAEEALEELKVPPVVAFTGHLLDLPSRQVPRFPPEHAEAVKRRIVAELAELDARIGYSSAACGSDVLFLEAMQERGGETNVILPFDKAEFFEASVNFAGEGWRRRALAAIASASSVETATRGHSSEDGLLYVYANKIIAGKTLLRGQLLDAEPMLLAVWDGVDSHEPGGTSDFLRAWNRTGCGTRIVSVGSGRSPLLKLPHKKRRAASPDRALPNPRGIDRVTVAMLFADLVGFSRLGEEQIPFFMDGFLGELARWLRKARSRPIFKNVWGDAFYFVFREPYAAAEYALGLRDFVRDSDWRALRLPEHLTMRIGLHAGPVFTGREPILGKRNFFGTHVNQAARIEPITSPGNVYASEQFVALLSVESRKRLDFRYVGVVTLPKDFGSYPIYHIKRHNEIE